ncbi:MAG: RNA recognition motif domain-containing protein [Neisseriaceae bacterium]
MENTKESKNKLFVASLSFKANDNDLLEIFSSIGGVVSAKVIFDRDGKSRGYGFVEMKTEEEADDAITKLNGSYHLGRAIVVNKQKPKENNNYN